MKQNISRFLSIVLVVALSVSLCVSAFAASDSAYEQKVGFWNWIAGKGSILNGFVGNTLGKVCAKSEDGYHHANSYQKDYGDGYYKCICSYCGKEFRAYESDLQQSYQQQVSDLPATGYNSAGRLIWQVTVSDCTVDSKFGLYYTGNAWEYAYLSAFPFSDSFCSASFRDDLSGFLFKYANCVPRVSAFIYLQMPISGSYRQLNTNSFSCFGITGDGSSVSKEDIWRMGTFSHWNAGSILTCSSGNTYGYSTTCSFATLNFYLPIFEIIPDTAIDTGSGGQYNITTRPTTITGGNYGIVGDNGQITTVTNTTQIINEGDNLYYNPATGQTQTITDWTYNYDGRIYNITLDTGDKVSVEYGDENITITENTINEGDTIVNNYTIYYMIDGTGSGDNPSPAPTACPHEWYKTGERQATCLIPAQRTYTCSICGEQKTETDPVLGHSWHAIQTVTTQYDENGNMTQEGYTIYECERCGEQYKSTNDTGPPPSGGGGSGGGSGDNIFSGIFGLIWDFFTFLFDLFSEFVVGGIKGFIGGLKDAGSSFFSILNPFSWDYGG